MRKILLFILCLLMTGCFFDKKNDIIVMDNNQDLVIEKSKITNRATFYNYQVDGVIIQLFAVKASDGSIRVLFNTCVSCNPSANAYFIQRGKYFECQNCKNKYTADEIGLKQTHGCSPIPILGENKKDDGNKVTISWNFILKYKNKFKNIKHYEG